jgi:hypothetical protein
MKARHFFTVSAAVMLSGCQICTDCEPVDYVFDEPDIVYGDTFYLDEGSGVFTEDVIVGDDVWTAGETWTEDVTLDYIPDSSYRYQYYYSAPTQSYRPQWNVFSRQRPYSGPPFTTPPMQPVPYPTETYYPFKRPSPGVYTPWRSTYYNNYSVPTYRPIPYFY